VIVRRLALAIACALMISTSVSNAQAPLPTLRVGAGLDVESTPLLYAQAAGLFEKAGLHVDVQKLPGGGTAIAAAVAGGGLEIGKASTLALIAAHAKGIPFVLLSPAAYYSIEKPDIPVIVASNSPLKGARDLNGKTLGVVSLNTTMRYATEAWVDQGGGDASSIHFVELSPTAMAAAIDQGRIDGGPLSDPALSAALSSGKTRVLGYPYNAIGKHFELADWFATKEWVAQNRDLAEKFARVMYAANAYVGTHEAAVVPVIASYVGIDASVLAKMHNPERGLYYDPSLIQPLIDLAAKYKAIPQPFPATDLISVAALRPPR
jgi:NitT/TauT family transport system substrate-binding protein